VRNIAILRSNLKTKAMRLRENWRELKGKSDKEKCLILLNWKEIRED